MVIPATARHTPHVRCVSHDERFAVSRRRACCVQVSNMRWHWRFSRCFRCPCCCSCCSDVVVEVNVDIVRPLVDGVYVVVVLVAVAEQLLCYETASGIDHNTCKLQRSVVSCPANARDIAWPLIQTNIAQGKTRKWASAGPNDVGVQCYLSRQLCKKCELLVSPSVRAQIFQAVQF